MGRSILFSYLLVQYGTSWQMVISGWHKEWKQRETGSLALSESHQNHLFVFRLFELYKNQSMKPQLQQSHVGMQRLFLRFGFCMSQRKSPHSNW